MVGSNTICDMLCHTDHTGLKCQRFLSQHKQNSRTLYIFQWGRLYTCYSIVVVFLKLKWVIFESKKKIKEVLMGMSLLRSSDSSISVGSSIRIISSVNFITQLSSRACSAPTSNVPLISFLVIWFISKSYLWWDKNNEKWRLNQKNLPISTS